MKVTSKIIAVLLALLMALSLGTAALAAGDLTDNYPEGYWTPVPTSPEGLESGVWFDFNFYLGEDWTEEEKAAVLEKLNSATWYANFDDAMVKVISDDDRLTGIYSRSEQPYICAAREIVPEWHHVYKNTAGIQVGDYYLDKEVFSSVCTEGFTDYFLPQGIDNYKQEHDGEEPTEEQIAEMRELLRANILENLVDVYWEEYTYSYNPEGTVYRYLFSGMPAPYVYYVVDYFIAQQMKIVVSALDASIRQADAAMVASSPWVPIATSYEDAEEGGYYIDLDEAAALSQALDTTLTEEDLEMVKNYEFYADTNRGVAIAKIWLHDENEIIGEIDYPLCTEDNADLYALIKVKPVTVNEDPEPEPEPEPEPSHSNSFWDTIINFFKKIADFFRRFFG